MEKKQRQRKGERGTGRHRNPHSKGWPARRVLRFRSWVVDCGVWKGERESRVAEGGVFGKVTVGMGSERPSVVRVEANLLSLRSTTRG